MKNLIAKFLITAILLFSMTASANVLFEGWFEVFVGAKKVGFLVERYEFTNNKFKAVTYLKTNSDGNDVTESLKAFSGADLKPLNYSYTSKAGKEVKVIDATFTGEKMNLKIHNGKNETKKTKLIKKGTFLSTFLLYMILNQKEGLSEGKSYTYSAIAEEDGTAYMGTANITKLEKVKGKEAYKILNKFKDQSFFSWVTPKGEFLIVRNPDSNIDVRFAETQEQATEGMNPNLKDLKLLFGKLPGEDGKPKEPSSKNDVDVPEGKGIEVKGAPPVTEPSPSGQ